MSAFSKVRKVFKRDNKSDLKERTKGFREGYNKLIEEFRMCFMYRAEMLPKNPTIFQVLQEPVDCTKMLEQVKAEKEAEELKIKKAEELKEAELNISKENKENK